MSAIYPVQTNIIIIALKPDRSPIFLKKLEKKGLLAIGFGTDLFEWSTFDFNDDQMEKAIQSSKLLNKSD